MSKNAWLKASINQHRINNPASAGFFCSALPPLSSPAFMIFFRGSLEALCKLQRITSGPSAAPRSVPLDGQEANRKMQKSSATRTDDVRGFWPVSYTLALFLSYRGVKMQNEVVHTGPELSDDEWDSLHHQAADEMNVTA